MHTTICDELGQMCNVSTLGILSPFSVLHDNGSFLKIDIRKSSLEKEINTKLIFLKYIY